MLKITDKMMGAVMFMLDNEQIVVAHLAKQHSEAQVVEAIQSLYDPVEHRFIPVPLSDVERDVLRIVIEESLWIKAYVDNGPTPEHVEEARQTLRDLAKLLEPHGVEVSRIAYC